MFFSTYVLTKKGPLAKIWLAAHWDKKLTRNEIKAIDLNQTIVQIVQPVVPIALRTSGELLIGVVRVYALKVKQLLKDPTDATVLLRATNVQLVAAKGKGGDLAKDALSVTMDLVVAKGAADDLCEADFDGIADILLGNKPVPSGGGSAIADEVVGNAWFTLEPSQYLEENTRDNQLMDDNIAQIRADLLRALGNDEAQRAGSTGSKKSSVSSVEKGRASNLVIGDDLLDIGAPLPDELLLSGVPDIIGGNAMDPFFGGELDDQIFAVPDLQPAATAANADRLPKKLKILNVLDAAATVLSKAEMEKCNRDRSDIVHEERRCGPISATEEIDRTTVSRIADGNAITTDPISNIVNPALRALFASAVQDCVAALRKTQADAATKGTKAAVANHDAVPFAPDNFEVPAPEFELVAGDVEEPQPRASRGKRDRAEKDGDAQAFSVSTIATMSALKDLLREKESIGFHNFSKGMRRVEAARSFVDVLALASHKVVRVQQAEPFAAITVIRTPQLVA
ncbi:double-strand-break repair protein Rad21, putative [Bodo saltans]|uniref:Double-strand-break repair protein Rad21, putative n=1 Tax=Bodo saltans TaxID=75058 RepID=A0A0S4ISR7_BODSA|nr:double-strand-break repair protein Rad21, putative [Bodo saltans]|eukprot:CUE91301.1 double-strand-break repair protein Rad21, putative [Bodo saltans]